MTGFHKMKICNFKTVKDINDTMFILYQISTGAAIDPAPGAWFIPKFILTQVVPGPVYLLHCRTMYSNTFLFIHISTSSPAMFPGKPPETINQPRSNQRTQPIWADKLAARLYSFYVFLFFSTLSILLMLAWFLLISIH